MLTEKIFRNTPKGLRAHIDAETVADIAFLDAFLSVSHELGLRDRIALGTECYRRICLMQRRANEAEAKADRLVKDAGDMPTMAEGDAARRLMVAAFGQLDGRRFHADLERGLSYRSDDDIERNAKHWAKSRVKLPVYKRMAFWRVRQNEIELMQLRAAKAIQFATAVKTSHAYARRMRASAEARAEMAAAYQRAQALHAVVGQCHAPHFQRYADDARFQDVDHTTGRRREPRQAQR